MTNDFRRQPESIDSVWVILLFVQPTPTRALVCTGAEYRVSYTQRVWVDVIACIYKPAHHRHLMLDFFLIGRLLRDAEYRYVMGHVEAQMYSVMSSVLDYTWLFKDAQSTVYANAVSSSAHTNDVVRGFMRAKTGTMLRERIPAPISV
jgi:hypothetical protein